MITGANIKNSGIEWWARFNSCSEKEWYYLKRSISACFLVLIAGLLSIDGLRAQTPERIASIGEIQRGNNLLSMAIWPEALSAFDNAIILDPSFATAYMKKANLLAKIGRTVEAEQLYAKAIQLNPYSAYIYDSRAKSRMLAQNYKDALSDLQLAVGLPPLPPLTENF